MFNDQILHIFTVFISFQELVELREAKQLLIQQKLELQGQVEVAQSSLEQEQKEHQATKDSRQQREEQLLAQTKEVQDKLVGPSSTSHQIHPNIDHLSPHFMTQLMLPLKGGREASQRRAGEARGGGRSQDGRAGDGSE